MWIVEDATMVMESLGPEPLEAEFTPEVLQQRARRRSAPIKSVVLDQTVVAGMGNLYTDEALHYAKIHPLRPANKLKRADFELLHAGIIKALRMGIDARGSSLGSTLRDHINVDGEPGQPPLLEDGECRHDDNVAAGDDRRQPPGHRPPGREGHEDGDDDHPVRERIEQLPEHADLAGVPGDEPVDPVAGADHEQDDEGRHVPPREVDAEEDRHEAQPGERDEIGDREDPGRDDLSGVPVHAGPPRPPMIPAGVGDLRRVSLAERAQASSDRASAESGAHAVFVARSRPPI